MKVILVGHGGSGKDHLKKKLLDRGFKQSVSYTTRPPRSFEMNDVDYHFVSEETFKMMIHNDEFREYNIFGEHKWYYGTSKEEFNKSNLFVMTPSGIRALSYEERADCYIIFLDIPEKIRLERLTLRKDADIPERRIKTDNEDFRDFIEYDVKITDPFFDDSLLNSKLFVRI